MEHRAINSPIQEPKAGKFSRYRSLRRATPQTPSPISDEFVQTQSSPKATSTNPFKRVPSRYHRRPQKPTTPPVPAIPALQQYVNTEPLRKVNADHKHSPTLTGHPSNTVNAFTFGTPQENGLRSYRPQGVSPVIVAPKPTRHNNPISLERADDVTPDSKSKAEAREEARLMLEGEYDRQQKLKQTQVSHDRHMPGSLTLVKQISNVNPSDRAPSNIHNGGAQSHAVAPKSLPYKMVDAPNLGKKAVRLPLQTTATLSAKDHPPLNANFSKPVPRSEQKTTQKKAEESPGKLDGFDVPISAVNSGERRVNVQCNGAMISLPVNTTTTVRNIINSASICMSEDIDPLTAILVESFSEYGLERSLRRYERVRDILNSWSSDTQHYLIIMTATQRPSAGLEQKDVPSQQPVDIGLQLYVSSRPRKWDKRWLRLQKGGQITVSKDQRASDTINICHLSDFDVYVPTRAEIKKLKAPKKHCLTVKSQQKSAMFLDGINYVHHFCSSDLKVLEQWQTAIQTWRSWYLISVLGQGLNLPKQEEPANIKPTESIPRQESIPYQLGSFAPLLDFSELRITTNANSNNHKPSNSVPRSSQDININNNNNHTWRPLLDFSDDLQRQSLERKHSVSRRSITHNNTNHEMTPLTEAISEDPESGFTGTGLLARSASRRSQGGRMTGRGVQTTTTKGKPLLDLTPVSEFVDGSLLRNIEAQSHTPEVKIDRGKRVEVDVSVGEGLG